MKPKTKKKTDSEKIELPADLEELVRITIKNNKTNRLTAEKIVELLNFDFCGVNEVTIFTTIANLFRMGHISESKSCFSVEDDVLE